MADNTLASLLARNALGYGETPVLDSLQGDGTTYDTADILRRVRKPNALVEALRVAQSSIPENKEHSVSLVNMLRGGLGTAANWLEGNPEIGKDTLAPLGAGLMGSAFAPQNALGIFGGRLAKTADHAALAKAEEMAAKGADRKAIWDQTGWFQGADGKWRFEIDDKLDPYAYSPGKIDGRVRDQTGKSLNEVREAGVQAPLYDVLAHPELYDAYSAMAMTPWKALPPGKMALQNAGGSWHGMRDGMQINNEISPSLTRGKSITLHEIQHGIQDIEGFGRGANVDMFKLTPEQHAGGIRQSLEVADALAIKEAAQREGVEPAVIEARWRSEGLPMQKDVGLYLHHDIAALKRMEERLRRRLEDAADPAGAYHKTAGEVEARNVQKRMDMTKDDRRAKPPWETEDVPTLNQVLRNYGLP